MSNTLGWAQAIRDEGGHGGRAYSVTGPRTYTARQRLETIAKVSGRELEFAELTEEQAKARWRQAGRSEELRRSISGPLTRRDRARAAAPAPRPPLP